MGPSPRKMRRNSNVLSFFYTLFGPFHTSCRILRMASSFYRLPVDVILITMDYLDPHDLLHLLQAVPYLTPFLTSRHLRAQDENGDTILHLIVEQGIEDMIKPLARIIPGNSIANNAKLTPLHQAVINVNQKMTRFLVDAGSDISARGPDGYTALHYTCKSKYPSSCDYIYNQGRLEILRILIDSGADLNAQTDSQKFTPIFCATFFLENDCIKPLLDAGADPLIPYWNGQTILVKAASFNNIGVMRMLLDAGMDVSGRGYQSLTPLMAAASYESDEAFDLLLKEGADPLMLSHDGISALHWAARRVNERFVRLLLEAGADVSAGDDFGGRTPLDWAIIGGKATEKDIKEVVKMLKEAEDSSRTPL
jgi:ankyrin repeat protein